MPSERRPIRSSGAARSGEPSGVWARASRASLTAPPVSPDKSRARARVLRARPAMSRRPRASAVCARLLARSAASSSSPPASVRSAWRWSASRSSSRFPEGSSGSGCHAVACVVCPGLSSFGATITRIVGNATCGVPPTSITSDRTDHASGAISRALTKRDRGPATISPPSGNCARTVSRRWFSVRRKSRHASSQGVSAAATGSTEVVWSQTCVASTATRSTTGSAAARSAGAGGAMTESFRAWAFSCQSARSRSWLATTPDGV